MFRGVLEPRRCPVHADTFYEWRAMPDGKQPCEIGRKDGASLAFAGVCDSWRGLNGKTLRSNESKRHDASAARPYAGDLEEEQWPLWLGERAGEPTSLMRPADDDGLLQIWTISRAVNSVPSNSPDLLDRIDDPYAPPPSDAPPGDNPA